MSSNIYHRTDETSLLGIDNASSGQSLESLLISTLYLVYWFRYYLELNKKHKIDLENKCVLVNGRRISFRLNSSTN